MVTKAHEGLLAMPTNKMERPQREANHHTSFKDPLFGEVRPDDTGLIEEREGRLTGCGVAFGMAFRCRRTILHPPDGWLCATCAPLSLIYSPVACLPNGLISTT